jgi:hypothetical protein
VLEARGYDNASAGVALIRDGNGTRWFETLLRYRGAAPAVDQATESPRRF